MEICSSRKEGIAMKAINVGQYKKDKRCHFVYLGEAKAKEIVLQPTERKHWLLDIAFEVPLEDQKPCGFLIRLESFYEEICILNAKLRYAIDNPVPHPCPHDLFHKAVTGMTPNDQSQVLLDELKKSGE